MKASWVFAISLTAAYIIYYAVTVARDLNGKLGEKKSNEDIFSRTTIFFFLLSR